MENLEFSTISPVFPVEIVEKDLWICAGDKVGGFSGANEAIGTMVLKFDNAQDMELAMQRLQDWIKVEVE